MTTRVTFKKQARATGLARIAEPEPITDVKIGGSIVGMITPPHFTATDRSWRASIRVKDPEAGGGWKWARLRQKFTDEPSARVWLTQAMPDITSRHDLHYGE